MITTDRESTHAVVGGLEVAVFRFSAEPARTGEFLKLLGLSPRVSNATGTWLELQGERGVVNVHGAGAASTTDVAPGSTDLVLIARDVMAFAAAVESIDGVQVDVWDEAFGRQATVSYRGHRVTINEVQSDPYGYDVRRPTPGPVTVVSHCYGSDLDQLRDLLLSLGFRPIGEAGSDGCSRLESENAAGVIMLHPRRDGADSCGLGLETADDLEQLAERLRVAGHRLQIDSATRRIEIVDPDGELVLITARS